MAGAALKLRLMSALVTAALLLGACSGALPEENRRLLAFGAFSAKKNGMGCEKIFDRDSAFAKSCEASLADAWGITDAQSARDVMNWLLDAGIREYSPERYNADEILDIAQTPESAGEEALSALQNELLSYGECISALKGGYGYTDGDLRGITTLAAFDYDRLVTIGRWCVRSGYLTEEEFFGYANEAALSAESLYNSWEQYCAAVMLGRAISAGWSAGETEIADILLNSEDSPYRVYEFGVNG